MSQASLQLLGTITASCLALIGIYISLRPTKQQTKINQSQNLFNDLQEERNELKREREELKDRVYKIECDLRAARTRELRRDDFIQELRNHIRLEKGPPPPPWPEELLNG